jgi:hypothetical protein
MTGKYGDGGLSGKRQPYERKRCWATPYRRLSGKGDLNWWRRRTLNVFGGKAFALPPNDSGEVYNPAIISLGYLIPQ